MPGADEQDDKNLPGGDEGQEGNPADKKDGKSGEEGDNEPDLSSMTPEQFQAEIKKLRKESAARRTDNKSLKEQLAGLQGAAGKIKEALGIKDDTRSPEEIANELKAQNETLQLELAISQVANANGIPADQMDYFGFLFQRELGSMPEDQEEMTDEQLAAIVQKVKGVSAKKPTKTGLDGKDDPPPSGDRDEITVEKFSKMNPGERGQLFNQNQPLYNRLFQEAKAAGKL